MYYDSGNFYIYCIKNTVNDKKYIGMTGELFRRWDAHLAALRSRTHENIWLSKDFNLYGEDVFKFTVLEKFFGTRKKASEREWWWMHHFKTYTEEDGYNASDIMSKIYTGEKGIYTVHKGDKKGFRIHDKTWIEERIKELGLTYDYVSGYCQIPIGGIEDALVDVRILRKVETKRLCECLGVSTKFTKWLFDLVIY